MSDETIVLGVAALLCAASTAFLLTPFTARLAHRFGVLDQPDKHPHGRKRHGVATPYLGGLAIFAAVLAGVLLIVLLPETRHAAGEGVFRGAILLAFGLGIVGLVDDVKVLPTWLRLGTQAAAAGGAWAMGFQTTILPWEAGNFVLTMVWIIGITNAFNLLDNMDGLAAGLAGTAALWFASMGLLAEQTVLTMLAAALGGAAFGFLAHNRHPARIFMGDAGALFLGFLLALIGIRVRIDNLANATFLVPVVVMGLPILDTTLVVASRIRNRRRPFTGARDHVSHRLVLLGLPIRTAVRLLYWSAFCLGWLGLAISRANAETGWILLALVLALGVYFSALLWDLPVYEEEHRSLRQLRGRALRDDDRDRRGPD